MICTVGMLVQDCLKEEKIFFVLDCSWLFLLILTLYKRYRLIGQVSRVFINRLGDLGSIEGRFIPQIFKMVLDTSLISTQQYKVPIKGKVEQSRERSSTLPYTSV